MSQKQRTPDAILKLFTAAEIAAIQSAASAVWNYIGADTMTMVAEEGKSTISRANVIELVCDAGRLEEEIRRSVMRPRYGVEETADDKAERAETWRVLEAKIEALGPLEIYAVVKPAFPYTRYGM